MPSPNKITPLLLTPEERLRLEKLSALYGKTMGGFLKSYIKFSYEGLTKQEKLEAAAALGAKKAAKKRD